MHLSGCACLLVQASHEVSQSFPTNPGHSLEPTSSHFWWPRHLESDPVCLAHPMAVRREPIPYCRPMQPTINSLNSKRTCLRQSPEGPHIRSPLFWIPRPFVSVKCIVHTSQHLNPKRTVVMRSFWLLSLCWEQWLRIQACREWNLLHYCFGVQWFSGRVDDYRKQGARSNSQSCKHKGY